MDRPTDVTTVLSIVQTFPTFFYKEHECQCFMFSICAPDVWTQYTRPCTSRWWSKKIWRFCCAVPSYVWLVLIIRDGSNFQNRHRLVTVKTWPLFSSYHVIQLSGEVHRQRRPTRKISDKQIFFFRITRNPVRSKIVTPYVSRKEIAWLWSF